WCWSFARSRGTCTRRGSKPTDSPQDQQTMCSTYGQAYQTSDQRREDNMTRSKLGFKLTLVGFASAVLFVLPALSAPISVFPKDFVKIAPVDESVITLVRDERGGAARGGAVRGGAVRTGAVRAGAVEGGAVRAGPVGTGAVRAGAVE